jgi:type I restriction enzyme, S subunit
VPLQFPSSWKQTRLGEVLSARDERPSLEDLALGKFRIVSKIGFDDGRIVLREGTETRTGMILIRPGDFVLSGINAAKGAIAIYDEKSSLPIAATIHYGAYIPRRGRIDVHFLWWLFRSEIFREILNDSLPGGIKTELKSARFLPIQVPLPPVDEQRRIVSRIHELARRMTEIHRLKEMRAAELDAFLSAALGDLFEGLSKGRDVQPLGSLCSLITDGPHQTPRYVQAGIPFVTVKNMVTGKLSFESLQYITLENHATFSKRCKPEFGDVLYSKDGATRGRPCYVDSQKEFSIFVSVALIKPLRQRLDGRYLCHLLNSKWIKDLMISRSRGDMIPHIVLGQIKNFPVPLPPLSEQRSIVAHLDHLEAKVAALKKLQSQADAEIDALMPSILSKAFRGEL